MEVDQFLQGVERLTGTALKGVEKTEREALRKILSNDEQEIDWSQFNELLLIVNKDRVERPFFGSSPKSVMAAEDV